MIDVADLPSFCRLPGAHVQLICKSPSDGNERRLVFVDGEPLRPPDIGCQLADSPVLVIVASTADLMGYLRSGRIEDVQVISSDIGAEMVLAGILQAPGRVPPIAERTK